MELRKPNLGEPGKWYQAGQRAGEPEREAVLAFLAAARAQGYLAAAEHERRAVSALAASHCSVLRPLVADLPDSIRLPAPPAVFTGERSLWERAVDAVPWLPVAAVAAWLVLVVGVTALLFWIASMTTT